MFTPVQSLRFADVPHMPQSGVKGHMVCALCVDLLTPSCILNVFCFVLLSLQGLIVWGTVPDRQGAAVAILCYAGRVHAYEGQTRERPRIQPNPCVCSSSSLPCSFSPLAIVFPLSFLLRFFPFRAASLLIIAVDFPPAFFSRSLFHAFGFFLVSTSCFSPLIRLACL